MNGDVENLTGLFGDFGHRASMITKEGFRAASVSATDLLPRQRVVLPNDLSTSLRYLDDSDLQRLLAAVNMEIDRRKRCAFAADADQAARPTFCLNYALDSGSHFMVQLAPSPSARKQLDDPRPSFFPPGRIIVALRRHVPPPIAFCL